MSSDRIPSDVRFGEIITQVSRYIETTRRLLRAYPEGRAPAEEAEARDIAIAGLQNVLSPGDAAAPYGWREDICIALAEVVRLAARLTSWYMPRVCLDRPHPDDEFNVPAEELALARWVELVEILGRASEGPDPLERTPEAGKATGKRLTPGARAIAAALDLLNEGKPVSLKGACARAGVDRGNLRKGYPDAVKTIETIGASDRTPRRGTRDRRTGDIDGVDDPED